MKRLLSCTSSEMLKMDGQELKQAILASEGRTVMTETVVAIEPLLGDLTNAELAVSFGSDMVLLNCFDCNNPEIKGLPECDNPVEKLKEIVGSPIGCNLEPVDLEAELMEERRVISTGRQARKETYIKAQELGFNFICLTGNPGVVVSNHSICEAIKEAKKYFKGLIIAGKMHAAGIDEPIVDMNSIKEFIEAGAHGALSLSAIGTSQEGADEGTIREIALLNKRCGIDIQHIGDAGFCGIALPENIMALSIAIRGKRHTYHKIASSINR